MLPINVCSPAWLGYHHLEVEAEELWSFVPQKATPHGLWLAMDKQTRYILAFDVGDRSRDSAKRLWANIPAASRAIATCSTAHSAAYLGVIPPVQQRSITTPARNTNHLERFTNTLRQRVSRLVRSTLACSQKVDNHIGVIRYCICPSNLTRVALLV